MVVLVPNSDDQQMDDPLLYWNLVALDMNRLGHSVRAPQGGPPLSARALAIVHLAMHDAYFAVFAGVNGLPNHARYLSPGPVLPATITPDDPSALHLIAGAAFRSLQRLYLPEGNGDPASPSELAVLLSERLTQAIPGNPYRFKAFRFGVACANAIVDLLTVQPGEPGADAVDSDGTPYLPKDGRGKFREDPGNPLASPVKFESEYAGSTSLRAAREYHAPFYGKTARRIAVKKQHYCADPPEPVATNTDYVEAFDDVVARGGAADIKSTQRSPYETMTGLYWAYDGANLLGTPPRMYNRIVRRIAWGRRDQNDPARNTADFVRLFALVNAALADAGIFAWQEKYRFEYWRPLSGVREHDDATGPKGAAGASATVSGDPGWRTHGAPRTNTQGISFKPPFPAYPSGHATFGAAAFQIVRRFYLDSDPAFDKRKPDSIAFEFVSEELDGMSRDLYQPYIPDLPITEQPGLVRTRVNRKFDSLWQAIHENGASRVHLGVHWVFDAFATADIKDPTGKPTRPGVITHLPSSKIDYKTTGETTVDGVVIKDAVIGGVPLGLAIADDIFDGKLMSSPAPIQPKSVQPMSVSVDDGVDATQEPMQKSVVRVKQTDTNIR